MSLRKIGLSPPSDVIIFIYMYKATCKYLKHVELCFYPLFSLTWYALKPSYFFIQYNSTLEIFMLCVFFVKFVLNFDLVSMVLSDDLGFYSF